MITLFRQFSKSIFAKIIFGLLIIAMAAFGVQQAVNADLGSAVIVAGDRETTNADFKRIFDNARKQEEERARRPVSAEDLIRANIHRRIANQLAEQNSVLAWLDKIRVAAGDTLITDAMRREQAFLNPVTGAFDKTQFLEALQRAGISEDEYQRETRDQLATMHFGSGMAMGLRAPRIYGALQASYALERRDISIFAVTPQMTGIPAPPTDAQLTQFINQNKAAMRRPEFRQLTLVLFTAGAVASQVTVPEAEIRQEYEARKASLAQAERRTFIQIPVRTPQAAQQVITALRAGQDPAAVARAAGVTAVTFTDKPQTSVPDGAVAQAAFAMTAGQVSDPIRGQLGMAVVKMISIAPGHAVSFEEARPAIEARMRGEAAADKVYKAVQEYEDARTAGKTMLEAARIAGGRVVSLPAPVTETGLLPNGQRLGAANLDTVFQAAFALAPGGESDTPEEFGNGEYFAVRVDRVIPAGLPTIAGDRPMLAGAWMGREVDKRMKAKAEELTRRISRGESIAAVAASVGGQVRAVPNMTRQPNPALGPLLQEIFLRRTGEAFSGRLPPPQPNAPVAPYAVGRVDAIHTPVPAIAARVVEAQRPQVSDAITRDMAQLASAAAKLRVKPKIRTERVDAAVGITEPAPATPAGKKK